MFETTTHTHRARRLAKIMLVIIAAVALAPLYIWPLLPVLPFLIPALIILLPPLLSVSAKKDVSRKPELDLDDMDTLRFQWEPKALRRLARNERTVVPKDHTSTAQHLR